MKRKQRDGLVPIGEAFGSLGADWTAVRVLRRGKVGHMEVGHPGPRQST